MEGEVIDWLRVRLLMREAQAQLRDDGFEEFVGYDPIRSSGDRSEIVGAVVLHRNAAGEEARERVPYPRARAP